MIQMAFARTDTYKNSFFVRTSTEWNKLKNNIVKAPSLYRELQGGTHSISTHVYHQSQRYAEYCPAGYNFQKVQKEGSEPRRDMSFIQPYKKRS